MRPQNCFVSDAVVDLTAHRFLQLIGYDTGMNDTPAKRRRWFRFSLRILLALVLMFPSCRRAEVAAPNGKQSPRPVPAPLVVVYSNDFNGPIGGTFPEWTSSPIAFHKTVSAEKGTLAAETVATVESPNRRERFLVEFGGPPVGRPGDPDWNRTRVDQTVMLSLKDLGAHTRAAVAFDVYALSLGTAIAGHTDRTDS